MPDPGFIKFFTVDEANASLPRIREQLISLREARRRIMALQARVDIEELTLAGRPVDRAPMRALLTVLRTEVSAFHQGLASLWELGCELKDLERGLVDFYAMRGNDVVYLCWMDGEDAVAWWHPLDAGLKGRAPLNGGNA